MSGGGAEAERPVPETRRYKRAPDAPAKAPEAGAAAAAAPGGTRVALERVTKERADGTGVLSEVSFEVAPGEHLAVIGSSGSGKTTLLRLLAAMDLPTVGSVLVDGVATAALDYEGLRNHRVRTGYVFEDQGLLANQPLFENVALPLRYHHGAKLHEEDVQLRVRALLTELDIEAFAPFPPARVNPSARKRALLARALVLSPRLLLIDEPQAYLLPSEQEVFARACESRRKEAGMTIIQADHDGEFGPLVPERVVHLERGRVLAIGAPGEIKA